MTSLPLDGSVGRAGAAELLDYNALRSDQQSSWDREAFDSLFERRLRSGRSMPVMPAEGVLQGIQSDRTVEDALALRAGPAAKDGMTLPAASAPASTMRAVEGGEPVTALQSVNAIGSATGLMEQRAPVGDSDAEAAHSPATATGIPVSSDAPGPEVSPQSLVVQLQGNQVVATIGLPHSALSDSDAQNLVATLRSELSWRGLALASLKVNGAEVWTQPGEGSDPSVTASGSAGSKVELLESLYGR